jgi:hypothetical protein
MSQKKQYSVASNFLWKVVKSLWNSGLLDKTIMKNKNDNSEAMPPDMQSKTPKSV